MSKRTKRGKKEYRVTVRFPKRDIEFMESLVREGEYTNYAEVIRTSLKHFRAYWESQHGTVEMKDEAVLAFEEDVKNASFRDWVVAHTSFMLPLHRYKGEISLHENVLIFRGFDSKGAQKSEVIVIPLEKIQDIHHGFDEVFQRTDDRNFGLLTEPLRIIYGEDKKRTVYLYVGFDKLTRKSNNQEWFTTLSTRLQVFKK